MVHIMTELLDPKYSMAGSYLMEFNCPWEALDKIADFIRSLGRTLDKSYEELAPEVWVHKTAKVAPSAYVGAPCIIGPGTEVRHCAFIRGSALIGENCVVGNSTEIKNAILFDHVEVPHFNYVGDSILGYHAHLGAGAVTSNVKSDRSDIVVQIGDVRIDTKRHKLGAILGDYAEVGCNSVLNPGTIVGRSTSIYPTCCVRGIVPSGSIYKADGSITKKV